MEKMCLILFLVFGATCLFAQDAPKVKPIQYDIETEYRKAIDYLGAFQYQKALDHIYECHRTEPDNLDYLTKLAWCYQQLGNLSESKIYYRELLKKSPDNVGALSNLGLIYEKELNHLKAKSYYRQLLEIDTANSYYYRINAYNALKTEEPLTSIVYFNKAHALTPKDRVVVDELAKLYYQLDAFDYAMSFTEKGLAQSPDNLRLLYTDARIHSKVDSFSRVIESLEHALSLGDTVPYYQTMLSVAYIHSDSLDQAAFHLNKLIDVGKSSEHTHHYLSIIYDKKGEPELSMHHLEEAITKGISPKVSMYYAELAAHYEDLKDYKKAIALYEEAYTHSENDVYLFHQARNTDLYYKDKKMALRLYKKYLSSRHGKYREYSESRVRELKSIIHQMGSR